MVECAAYWAPRYDIHCEPQTMFAFELNDTKREFLRVHFDIPILGKDVAEFEEA